MRNWDDPACTIKFMANDIISAFKFALDSNDRSEMQKIKTKQNRPALREVVPGLDTLNGASAALTKAKGEI